MNPGCAFMNAASSPHVEELVRFFGWNVELVDEHDRPCLLSQLLEVGHVLVHLPELHGHHPFSFFSWARCAPLRSPRISSTCAVETSSASDRPAARSLIHWT